MSDALINNKTGEPMTEESMLKDLTEAGWADDKPSAPVEEKAEAAPVKTESLDEAEKASKQGWKPEGELSAKEFNGRGELYEEIKLRGKETKDLRQTVDELKNLLSTQQQAGYAQAMDELKSMKNDAIAMQDVDAVNNLDQQIAAQQQNINAAQVNAPSNAALAWKDKHIQWMDDPGYEAQEMRKFAFTRDKELAGRGFSEDEHLKIIDKDLAHKYPNRFNTPAPMVAVESDREPTSRSRASGPTFADLNSDQKQAARHFERSGVMKIDEYIHELDKLGEIK